MTREKAIQVLQEKIDNSPLFKDEREAYDMAIEALSADGVGRYENAMQKLREMPKYLNGVKEKQITKISDDEVVRCKDCRYFKKIAERSDSGLCHRDIVASAWKENGYCSKGESKGGDDE